MRLKFKVQQYQTDATDAVCDAFEGQPNQGAAVYLRDLGTLPARGGMDALFEAADFQQSLECFWQELFFGSGRVIFSGLAA